VAELGFVETFLWYRSVGVPTKPVPRAFRDSELDCVLSALRKAANCGTYPLSRAGEQSTLLTPWQL
jgi:hypothetical protein